MRVFGHDTMTVSARSVIQRETTGMELALVMDNTGSMWDSAAFNACRHAAHDLIDILYGDEDEIDNLWVSLVPYVGDGQHRQHPHQLARVDGPGASPIPPAFART